MARFYSDAQLQQMASEFHKLGYLRLEAALSTEQIARFNASVDRLIQEHPGNWVALSDSFCEAVDILPHTANFDEAIENLRTLEVLTAILGERIAFEEFAVMLRNPTGNLKEVKGWHRDLIRDYKRRREIDAVSIMLYLTDVSPTDHCFAIVPESHERLLDLNPMDVAADAGVDLVGPAGTAVIFHARAIHNARLKQNSGQRRTLQAYFSNRLDQRTNEWTTIPPRLYQKKDPALPKHFYAKWNVTNILDGVGKRPADINPSLPMAEQIKEVQRHGKIKMQM
jgi:ectoine hydroxylase-related dioxygenase (phytanoyl-CoA dioxygenase family)